MRCLTVFLLTLVLSSGGTMEEVPILWRFHTRADCTMSADYLNKDRARSPWRYICVETDPARLAALRRAMEPPAPAVSRALVD